MILKLCRIRIHTKYEYYEGDAVDTSAFPECEGLDAAQCLRWINEHPERVGAGDFAEWRDDSYFEDSDEIEEGVFVHAISDEQEDAQVWVNDVVFDAAAVERYYQRGVHDKHPILPDDAAFAAARAKMAADKVYAAALKKTTAVKDTEEEEESEEEGDEESEEEVADVEVGEADSDDAADDGLDVADLEAAQAAIRDEPQPEQVPWMAELGRDAHGAWATTLVSGVAVKFRWCPPGSFMMGAPTSETGRRDGEVQHEVELTRGFWLGETPVTQALWKAVMGSNPSEFSGDDRPVERVSWEDCQQFLASANGMRAKLLLRLPTDAEWEYACRAGTKGPTWLGENSAAVLDRIAWYDANSGGKTQPVKGKECNPRGLYDMLGNVWEWCSDWNADLPSRRVVDPVGPDAGTERVYRGGSWYRSEGSARAAVRLAVAPGIRAGLLGFRLARGQ